MGLILESAIVLVTSTVVTMLLLWLVRRVIPPRLLKETNDVAGIYITLFGTLYTVILAFMLFAVWERFDRAQTVTEQEALALGDVFRLAGGLSEPNRSRLQTAVLEYLRNMVEKEWESLARGEGIPAFNAGITGLWQAVIQIAPRTGGEQVILDNLIGRFTEAMDNRKQRLMMSESGLPAVLWIVMIVGAVGIAGFSCLFGVDRYWLHTLKAALLNGIVALVLYTIFELNGPFKGIST